MIGDVLVTVGDPRDGKGGVAQLFLDLPGLADVKVCKFPFLKEVLGKVYIWLGFAVLAGFVYGYGGVGPGYGRRDIVQHGHSLA